MKNGALLSLLFSLLVGNAAIAQSQPEVPPPFLWPDAQVAPLLDLRYERLLREAQGSSREAERSAHEAQANAWIARTSTRVAAALFRQSQPMIVAEGVQVKAVPDGPCGYGQISYSTGYQAVGSFDCFPALGVVDGGPPGPVSKFSGDVRMPYSLRFQPMLGRWDLSNGDMFTGRVDADDLLIGKLKSKDGTKTFVGEVRIAGATWEPAMGALYVNNKLAGYIP